MLNLSTNSQCSNKKRIESLYVLKAICAFFVVSIHVNILIPDAFLQPIAGVGTPCFLCITGYLLYSANKERELGKCIAWTKKCFWLALVFNIFYFIVAYFFRPTALYAFDMQQCIRLFALGSGIRGSNLWYLTALCEALLILWLIIKFVPRIINFLPFLFIIAFVLRNFEDNPAYAQYHLTALRCTCLVMSLPFLATGYLLHKHQQKILTSINVNVCLVISALLVLAEYFIRLYLGVESNYFFLFTYPLVVFLMLLCVKYHDFTLPVMGTIGKKHSPNIYYFHGCVLWCADLIDVSWFNSLVFSLIVYCSCLPLSICFNLINKYWIDYVWNPLRNHL